MKTAGPHTPFIGQTHALSGLYVFAHTWRRGLHEGSQRRARARRNCLKAVFCNSDLLVVIVQERVVVRSWFVLIRGDDGVFVVI